MNKTLSVLMYMVFLSCSHHENTDKTPLLLPYAEDYQVAENQIVYQFYEKFGFTDICTHTRAYFNVDASFEMDTSWRSLPFSSDIRKHINSLSNKVDTIPEDSFLVVYQNKNHFGDISLVTEEFIKDSSVAVTMINLLNGSYRVTDSTWEVFNPHQRTVYYEYHHCDDTN